MTAIREEGKINEDTTLIDVNMMGVPKIMGIYLIESGKKCLIDAGTHIEARKILKQLKQLDAFPPDMIIITHSHWDHVQAIPFLNQRAKKLGKEIKIYAKENAIPKLRDQSWNDVFETGPFNNIEDEVITIKEGDIIDLDGLNLKIFEVPGHLDDHIAILDEKNENFFVGDAIGYKLSDEVFLPPLMPPNFNKDSYLRTIEKIKEINYNTICLDHFGYIYEEEARNILDESIDTFNRFIIQFEKNEDHIDDIPYLIENVLPKLIPKSEIARYPEMLVKGVTYWVSQGYKIYRGL